MKLEKKSNYSAPLYQVIVGLINAPCLSLGVLDLFASVLTLARVIKM